MMAGAIMDTQSGSLVSFSIFCSERQNSVSFNNPLCQLSHCTDFDTLDELHLMNTACIRTSATGFDL